MKSPTDMLGSKALQLDGTGSNFMRAPKRATYRTAVPFSSLVNSVFDPINSLEYRYQQVSK